MSYYAVGKGRTRGVYRSWDECKRQVDHYSGARYKKFFSSSAAHDYVTKFGSSIGRQGRQHYSSSHDCPVVFSDSGNSRQSASTGVGVYWGENSSHEKLHGPQTNQRAELVSACRTIESAISRNLPEVDVCTDSMYTVKSVTVDKRQTNGWKTASGGNVKNREEIQQLVDLSSPLDVKWDELMMKVVVSTAEIRNLKGRIKKLKTKIKTQRTDLMDEVKDLKTRLNVMDEAAVAQRKKLKIELRREFKQKIKSLKKP